MAIGYYDAKLLLEASKETRIHMQMVFALLIGLRKSEINGLKYSDIDYLAGLIARKSRSDAAEHVMSNKYKFSRQYVLLIDDDAELICFSEWIDRLLTDRSIERKEYFVNKYKLF